MDLSQFEIVDEPDPNLFEIVDDRPALGNAIAAQLGKGLLIGWFDEAQGVEAGVQNALRNLIGKGTGKSFGEAYQEKVDSLRDVDAQFEEQNPGSTLGLQLLGATLPALATGGASLATGTAAKIAPSALGGTVKTLYGVGLKGSPSVGRLAAMGAAGGALYGAGEEEGSDRVSGGLLGGGLGAVAAPVAGKTVEHLTDYLGGLAARHNVLGRFSSQRGALFGNTPARPSYSKGELLLAKELKNTPIDKVTAGAAELETALADEVPLFLPEALGSPKVSRNARFVANYDPSMEFSQSAIQARTEGAPSRAVRLLEQVSPEGSQFEGAMSLTNAASDIVENMDTARLEAVRPLYRRAYDSMPTIESPELEDLMANDKVLTRAISQVKKTANNAKLPDNASEILVKARQEIGDQIERAKSQGAAREARDLTDTYNRLNKVLHGENKLLHAADLEYQRLSTAVDEVDASFISRLKNFSADKVQSVSQIFLLPPERITALRSTFARAGKLNEWNAGIRAHLQNSIESTKSGRNFTDKLIGNTLQKSKLKAALGNRYESVVKGLNYEARMFEGKNVYHAGSSTAGNLEERANFQKAAGILGRLKDGDFVGALAHMFSSDLPAETAQELARIYFDPRQGSEALNKIVPLLRDYARVQGVATKAGRGVGIGSKVFASMDESPRVRGGSAGSGGATAQPSSSTVPKGGTARPKTGQPQQGSIQAEAQGARQTRVQPGQSPQVQSQQGMQSFPNSAPGADASQTPYKPSDVKAFVSQQPPLIQAVIRTESTMNPRAVSKAGARGLMQLMPENVRKFRVSDPFDPVQNVRAGTELLQMEIDRWKDLRFALAAYNAGGPKVEKAKARAIKLRLSPTWENIRKFLPKETQDYVPKVLNELRKVQTV